MADALGGMFSPTEQEIRAAQQAATGKAAQEYGMMSPMQQAGMMSYQTGANLANQILPSFGMQNPQVQRARQTDAIMGAGDTDLSTSKGLLAKAEQFRQAGDIRTAMALALKGKEMEKQEQAAILANRKQDFQEGEAADLKRLQVEAGIEAKKAQLQQQADLAQQRSQDMRYSADQRAEAAKYAADARREIAGMMAALKQSQGSTEKPLKPAEEVRLRQAMGKDRSAVQQVATDAEVITKTIDDLLKHPGLPGVTGWSSMAPDIPGSDASGARALLKSVKGKVASLGRTLQSQQGGKLGNMAVQEWKIVADAIANLDPTSKEFKSQLAQVAATAKGLESRITAAYSDTYSPYFDSRPEMKLPEKAAPPDDFNAKWKTLPKGQSLVGPDGKTYTKK